MQTSAKPVTPLQKVKSALETMIRRNSLNVAFSKWWPSSGGVSSQQSGQSTISTTRSRSFSSSVAIQKLRESKWFDAGEERIFCAVIESGFIVELRHSETGESWFGVVANEAKKLEKPTASSVKIYTVKLSDSHKRLKIFASSLENLWRQGYQIRINNVADKTKKPHSEKDILAQIKYASKSKMAFHNSQNFAEFCRYGDRPQDNRKRQISECAKWGGTNMGATIIYFAMQARNESSSKSR